MMQPLVSIVIPVFNQRAEYFRRCIESALSQGQPAIEIVISDNHSTNDCDSVVAEFSSDPRIRLVRPPRHLPIVQHFAYAGFQARGEFISYLPSDDCLEPNWLTEMLSALQKHPAASFAYCDIYRHDQKSGQTSRYRGDGYASRCIPNTEAMHIFGKLISGASSAFIVGALIRSNAFFKCGGVHDAGAMYAGDLTIGLGLLRYGDVVYVAQPLVHYTAWAKSDEKMTGSKWHVVTCQDVVKILAWAENDLVLLDIARRGRFSFKKSRSRMLAFFLLTYIQMAIDEKDNSDLLDSFQKALKLLSKGWLPIWCTSFFRSSLISHVMNYLRAKLGEKVKSIFM
jgi:GT2 family glycosyltransferase